MPMTKSRSETKLNSLGKKSRLSDQMWGDDSAEDLLETHREGGDEDVAKHEAREGAWEEGDGMGMIGDHKPVRMTRQRSLSIPDSLAGLVSGLDASGKKGRVFKMREHLREAGFSEETVFSDAYIEHVMLRTKDGRQRTFEYSANKLQDSLRWRREYGAGEVTYSDVSQSLAPDHMIWKGQDSSQRPILYAMPSRMDLETFDRDNYLKAHVYLIERGIEQMQGDVTSFVLVADSSGISRQHVDVKLMRELVKIATLAYPDRMGSLIVGPVNMLVRATWSVLSRLIGKNLASKIQFVKSPRKAIMELLPPGADPPPDWLA